MMCHESSHAGPLPQPLRGFPDVPSIFPQPIMVVILQYHHSSPSLLYLDGSPAVPPAPSLLDGSSPDPSQTTIPHSQQKPLVSPHNCGVVRTISV